MTKRKIERGGNNRESMGMTATFVQKNTNIFVQLLNVFVQIVKFSFLIVICICPNCKMYLSQLPNIVVQTDSLYENKK